MIPDGLPPWLVLTWLFLLGAVLGSFLNVVIHRIPEHERVDRALRSLVHPPSRCPHCFNRIQARDNVPIVSWLLLRGRCRHCRRRISPRYPIIELLNGLLFVIVYWCEIPLQPGSSLRDGSLSGLLVPAAGPSWLSPVAFAHLRYAWHMILIEALLAASVIDLDLMIIPDGVTLPALAAGVIGAAAFGHFYLVPLWFEDRDLSSLLMLGSNGYATGGPHWLAFGGERVPGGFVVPGWTLSHPHWHGLAVSVAGVLVGGGAVWLIRIVGQAVLKQEAMGFGDVVLMAMIGAFLGWQPALVVFCLAPVLALAALPVNWMLGRAREIPYGPYLSLAALATLLGWRSIWPGFERLFALGVLVPIVGLLMIPMIWATLVLLQAVKRLLGVPTGEVPWIEEWTPGDQLAYLACEWTDPAQGNWPTADGWAGGRAARGLRQQTEWKGARYGHESSWRQAWQRRPPSG